MSLKTKSFSPDSNWGLTGQMVLSGGAVKLVAAPSYSEDFEGLPLNSTPPGWAGTNASTCQVKSLDGQKVMEISGGNPAGAYYSVNLPDGCLEWQTTASDVTRLVFAYQKWDLAAGGGYGAALAPGSSFCVLSQNAGTPPGFALDYPFYGDAEQNTLEFTSANFPQPNVLKLQCITNANGDVEAYFYINGVKQRYHKDTFRRYTGQKIAIGGQFYYTVGYIKFWPTLTGGFTTPAFTPLALNSWTSVSADLDGKAMRNVNYSNWLQYKVDSGAWTTVPDSGSLAGAPAGTSIYFRANNNLMNEMDASSDVAIYNLSVQIDGVWDPVGTVPDPATGLKVTASSASEISLSWTPPAVAPDSYNVYRCLASSTFQGYGSWIRLANVPVPNFTDAAPLVNQVAAYAVESLLGSSTGLLSNVVQAVAALGKNTGLDQLDYLFPIQKAIYSRINGAVTDLSLKIVPVYSIASVPENLPAPYIVIGDVEGNKDASTKTRAGQEVVVTVWCFSEYLGTKEVSWIAGQITQLIMQAKLSLVLDGLNVIISELLGSHNTRDTDGRTMIRGTRFRFVIMDLASQLPPKP